MRHFHRCWIETDAGRAGSGNRGSFMKLIHLSDLHLGKRLNEFSLLEDQKYILTQILSLIAGEQPDGVLLAGDIYDKPIPPAEAVQLFDYFLTKLADQNIPVFVVNGNHDSAERLAFGAQLMSGRGVYVAPVYDGQVRQVCLEDTYGEVQIHLLPFLKPALVRHALEEEGIDSEQAALAAAVSRVETSGTARHVLVAHQFVTGASRCESEEIPVGGLDNVEAAVFEKFDYVALGHLHSPQRVGRESLRYCGTPLKYSFSEAGQEKTLTVAELRTKGDVRIRELPLRPLRDLRKVRGSYMEVTARSFYEKFNQEDYVHITLTDEEDIPDGLAKLRVIYPNLTQLAYDNRRTRGGVGNEGGVDLEQKSELALFEEFYERQNNQEMSGEQRDFARRLIEKLREGDQR